MNPQLLLSLWRERWGKADGAIRVPYLRGFPTIWGAKLSHAAIWSIPGVALGVCATCLLVFAWTLTVQLSLGGQLGFSVGVASVALFARRYRGTLVTFILLGLSLLISARYLYWRYTSTLGQDFNSDFVFGFVLCAAELYLWLLMLVGFVRKILPLKRASVSLPADSSELPTVDIFILADGQSIHTVRKFTQNALSLDWPHEKLKIHILDGHSRNDIMGLAASQGASYFSQSGNPQSKIDLIDLALPRTKNALIVVVDDDQVLNRDFLATTIGWFVRDRTLGLLHTPGHFLDPFATAQQRKFLPELAKCGSCAIVRRSAIGDERCIQLKPSTPHSHTGRHPHRIGFHSAFLGYAENSGSGNTQPPQSTRTVVRIDHPHSVAMLALKTAAQSLERVLQFYYPVVRLVFYAAPATYLLAGVHLIQTTPEWFAVYALPALLHIHIAQTRMSDDRRLTLWGDIRETILAWYMLAPTTLALLRTQIGHCTGIHTVNKRSEYTLFPLPFAIFFTVAATLTLAGFFAGLFHVKWWDSSPQQATLLYLLWCTGNLMLLAATVAVAEETRHIQQQIKTLSVIPAMIQLPSGHTTSCVTENFPEVVLSLRTPDSPDVAKDSRLTIAIFCNNHEFAFPAQVLTVEDGVVRVCIEEESRPAYQRVGLAVLSRGKDWPQWLPDRNADHPLPAWLTRRFDSWYLDTLRLIVTCRNAFKWVKLGRWFQ